MLAYQTDFLSVMAAGVVNGLRTGTVQDPLSSRLSVSKAFVPLLIYSSFYLVGLARGTVVYGVQVAWGFPPRCKWTYGEVFHPAVVPRPHFS